jgi:hypothetical protein
LAGCAQLDEEIADRRGLDRPGNNFEPGRGGQDLEEQIVGRAAPDYVDHLHASTSEALGLLDGLGHRERHGVDDTAHELGVAVRYGLTAG